MAALQAINSSKKVKIKKRKTEREKHLYFVDEDKQGVAKWWRIEKVLCFEVSRFQEEVSDTERNILRKYFWKHLKGGMIGSAGQRWKENRRRRRDGGGGDSDSGWIEAVVVLTKAGGVLLSRWCSELSNCQKFLPSTTCPAPPPPTESSVQRFHFTNYWPTPPPLRLKATTAQ